MTLAQDEPQADPEDLPRIAPLSPDQALASFRMRPGLRLELAAHEPIVEDPISISFDEDGRLFAVEMRGYSERRDDERGRIRMLFDDDDDGFFDRSTVFAEGFRWPTGLTCSKGGVFVIAVPDLIWLKDTDGDGVADERKVVFTGFGEGVSRLNVQGLPNSLHWGPDNRIWGSGSTLGGKIRPPGAGLGEAVNISGRDFSFDPVTLDFRAENGRAQYGMSFDSTGNRFVCSNSNHIIAVMWEQGWTSPNPWFSLPRPLTGIAVDGGAAPVFRISPDEPWRIVRTRWRVAGVVRGIVEGGGRVSGYFTGASGVTVYTGDALGEEFANNAFTGDVGSNLLHRKVVSRVPDGVALEARRPADETDREFLASTDNWFRPTTSANAPDGCLYICDMYREVIEHPWSLPEGIKKHLDLNSGNDRGRIYRVSPEKFQRRPSPALSRAANDELASLLDHPNGWHRVTAQRLLWERGDARAGAGWGRTPDPGSPEGVFRELLTMANGEGDERMPRLRRVLEKWPEDPWLRAAAINAVRTPEEAGELFAMLSENSLKSPALVPLAEVIGRIDDDGPSGRVFAPLLNHAGQPEVIAILEALGKGLNRAGSSLSKADPGGVLGPLFQGALARIADPGLSDADRIGAINLAGFSPGQEADVVLLGLIESGKNPGLVVPAARALATRKYRDLPKVIVGNWTKLPEATRGSVLQLALEHHTHALQVLEAIDRGNLPREALTPGQLATLRLSKNAAIRKMMVRVFPMEKKVPRSEIVADYREALRLKGDPEKGKVIFGTACASCHRHGEQGFAVGPDLATFRTAGADSILGNLLDPNKEVAPQYQSYLFTLKSGEQFAGVIAHETTSEVTVKQAFGVEKTFPRTDVTGMKGLGQSLMPEGLEATLTKQDVADLIAFITR